MRIAAVADLHCGINDSVRMRERLEGVGQEADLLLVCGDLTNYGTPPELEGLLPQLLRLRIPVISVLGNHDYESDRAPELLKLLREAGVKTLDEGPYERDGVGFAGVKGFCGGFGKGELTPFGEPEVKAFVRASVEESLKLERAFSHLRARHKVCLLHYAPIPETAAGEPVEIFPFLGSSRLADVCDRYAADVIFHGHAHHGSPEGKTRGGIPVFNVAYPLLQSLKPPQRYRVVEIG